MGVRAKPKEVMMTNLEKKAYVAPRLADYGNIAALTGQQCWRNKTLGYPSDTNYKFIPITNCTAGGS